MNITASGTITHLDWQRQHHLVNGKIQFDGCIELAIVDVCLGEGMHAQRIAVPYPHESCKPGMQVSVNLSVTPVGARDTLADVMGKPRPVLRGNVHALKDGEL